MDHEGWAAENLIKNNSLLAIISEAAHDSDKLQGSLKYVFVIYCIININRIIWSNKSS